jgi:hypothetical protein
MKTPGASVANQQVPPPRPSTAWGNPAAPAPVYFARKLHVVDEASEEELLDSELLRIERSIIVLGEPGMGKSELMRELGRAAGISPVSAPRFMQSKDPAAYVVAETPLLIDGLDEAIARAEKVAVDRVLAQLEAAGCPRFILSCRSREWQSRSLRSLKEIYGTEPLVVSIEELTRAEAAAFWLTRGFASAAEPTLAGLDAQGLSDLYKNPLTLSLLGRVADSGKPLPPTRAELFRHVCELTWREQDVGRESTRLAQITEEQALSSSGAIMTSMILAGADAVRLGGLAEVQDGEVWIGDFEALPGAAEARAAIASKLFKNVGVGRAAPIHRVVAEYLGARWLCAEASTGRARRRVLGQLHGGGAVPSSLRGLHAWLAFHSPPMFDQVVAADPFGLLRYGETALLTAAQADSLLDALERLALIDPYFRAQDWDARSAKGLAQAPLAPRIGAILADARSNFHLRTLLLEAIKDTPLASSLSATLENLALDPVRHYGEREEAVEAVFAYRDLPFWQGATGVLVDQASEDSSRLAGRVVEMVDYEVGDELLASVLLAQIGLQVSAYPRKDHRGLTRFRHFEKLASALSPARAKALLGILSSRIPPKAVDDHDIERNLSHLLALLLMRAVRAGTVHTREAPALWRWLGQINERSSADKDDLKSIAKLFAERTKLRRGIQQFGIRIAGKRRTPWQTEFFLEQRSVGLIGNTEDVVFFLREIAKSKSRTRRVRSHWRDLVRMGIWRGEDNSKVIAAAREFPGLGLKELATLRRAIHPPKPGWKIRQEAEDAAREQQELEHQRNLVASFTAEVAKIRSGDVGWTFDAAKVYLGLIVNARREEKPAAERLSSVFNDALAADFLAGFEATLHRSDLPSLGDIADSYAEGRLWSVSYALIAALLERVRTGKGFGGVGTATLQKALLICVQQRGGICRDDDDVTQLRIALEEAVAPKLDDKRALLRCWIEPFLTTGRSPHLELQVIEHLPSWNEAASSLAREWLLKFPQIAIEAEADLVNALARASDKEAIVEVAKTRDSIIFWDEDRALAWVAVDVVYRFGEVRGHLANIGRDHPEFLWLLRDGMEARRRGPNPRTDLKAVAWIISAFRSVYPYAVLLGSSVGDKNGFDATDFIRSLIATVAGNTSDEAAQLMVELDAMPADTYSADIRHMLAEQLQKRAEESFAPLAPSSLSAILGTGAPTNIDDLRSLIAEELSQAQKVLLGDDLDQVRDFWTDANIPRDENRCRDRLAAIIERPLQDLYGVNRMPEADMPHSKRVDLAFARGLMQLPMEVKGQWHEDVWNAANSQLAAQYLIDWRSEGRGVYCVLWFGDLPSATGRRLKAPPAGVAYPTSPDEMREALVALIPEPRRPFIDVVVLDLSSGRKSP